MTKKNEYMLWGFKKASQEEIDKQFTKKIKRTKKTNEEKPKIIKQTKKKETGFILKDPKTYTANDLEDLKKEFDRLEKAMEEEEDNDKKEKMLDLQNTIYDIIDRIEFEEEAKQEFNETKQTNSKEMIKYNKLKDLYYDLNEQYIASRGDPNIKAKMNELEKEISKLSASMRGNGFKKGSSEAIELGKRLAEARKAKSKNNDDNDDKETKEMKEPKQTKALRPFYQFKDVPGGYREATEDEAITANNKIGEYGKYVVDAKKYQIYKDYGILLSFDMKIIEAKAYIKRLEKEIKRGLFDKDLYKVRLSNNPDNEEYKDKLEEANNKIKTFNPMYKWIYKNIFKTKAPKIELDKPEIKESKPKPEIILEPKKKVIIDPRTNEPIDEEEQRQSIIKAIERDDNIMFMNNDIKYFLKKKYFKNGKIKSNYAKKLFDKDIILEPQYYLQEDFKKYFYQAIDKIGGKLKLSSISQKLNPVNWVGKKGRQLMTQSGEMTNKDIMPTVVAIGKPVYTDMAMSASTALTGNPELGKMASDALWNKMGAKYDPSVKPIGTKLTKPEILKIITPKEKQEQQKKNKIQGFSRFY